MPPSDARPWWQTAVFYEIYPQSFADSNGDGFGDLPGIQNRLDYLQWLGVDAVWITPFYPSPMADFGYDVAGLTEVHERYGSMEDFTGLLGDFHERGIRVIVDLVPNHTSSRHPWFLEARSARDHPRRNWYIWKDPGYGGGPPNNWISVFGMDAWTLDEATGQYYYHTFSPEEPDLDWRNPEVPNAFREVMRFWLDLGVDGFRIDALWMLIKDRHFRDNPKNPAYKPGMMRYDRLAPAFSNDQPETFDFIAAMRETADAYPDRVLVGELYLPVEDLMNYYGGGRGVHMPTNYSLILAEWEARTVAKTIDTYEGALPTDAWPTWALGNHDQPRLASRLGPAQARVAAMLLLTLRGTPMLYYGDEIGITDAPLPPGKSRDPQTMDPHGRPREPFRSPMAWDADPSGGFTTGEPWVELHRNYDRLNVAAQQDDPDALLGLYRRLIRLRKQEPALHQGCYVPIPAEGGVIAYLRVHADDRLLIVLNLSGEPATFTTDRLWPAGEIVLGTNRRRESGRVDGSVRLDGNEAVIVRLEGE